MLSLIVISTLVLVLAVRAKSAPSVPRMSLAVRLSADAAQAPEHAFQWPAWVVACRLAWRAHNVSTASAPGGPLAAAEQPQPRPPHKDAQAARAGAGQATGMINGGQARPRAAPSRRGPS